METPDFTLHDRGSLFRVFPRQAISSRWTILVAVVIAWGTLLVLSAVAGLAVGHKVDMPFLADPVPYARFLVGLPLLLAGRVVIARRLSEVATYLWASGIVKGEDRTRFREAWSQMAWAGHSLVTDIVALIVAYVLVLLLHTQVTQDNFSTWFSIERGSGERLTPAGWWYSVVSMPMFSFVLLRSLWRMIAWWRFLWKLSRLDLHLLPTHPDRAGGLGILETAQTSYAVIVVATSTVLAANLADLKIREGVALSSEAPAIVAYAVLAVLFIVSPLLAFARRLFQTRQRGLVEYGDLGDDLFGAFNDKWTNKGDKEQRKLLGDTDPSSLADFGYAYEVVTQMRMVPFTRPGLMFIVISAVVPFAPLLLMDYSVKELAQRLLGILG